MLVLAAAVIFLLCVAADRLSGKIGLPALVLFMAIGMFFGVDGPLHFAFDDYEITESLCSTALIFIMFYGGFNLKWKYAKSIWPQAVSLSTIGVLITTGVAMVLLHVLAGMAWQEAFILCAVLGSTDAASIFSILRQKNLNLKYNTASLLEVESGSNDPVSYMLTCIAIQIALGQGSDGIVSQIFFQLFFGLLVGFLMAKLTVWLFTKSGLIQSDISAMGMIGMVLLCYGMSELFGGNAYLAVYLMGVITGNHQIPRKSSLAAFFDGLTSISQVIIFFFLGLLSTPSLLLDILPLSLLVFGILLGVARPAAVILVMRLFKSRWNQIALVSFAGLRGAASCVFAVMAVQAGVFIPGSLFQIVFMVCLLSVTIQGCLLPYAAKRLNMVDTSGNVQKTFNDYADANDLTLLRVYIEAHHPWVHQPISKIAFAPGSLALMIERKGQILACTGQTVVEPDDVMILNIPPCRTDENENLREISIDARHPWAFQTIVDLHLPKDTLIAMVIRNEQSLIPGGSTEILPGDRVVLIQDSAAYARKPQPSAREKAWV